MFGVHYLQQISDRTMNAGIHIEPGIWATVPRTTAPKKPPTIVRMASIPHGTAVLAQGEASVIAGPPIVEPTDIRSRSEQPAPRARSTTRSWRSPS